MGSNRPKVIVIGWHGAEWKAIHPLVDAGLMPNLRALIERGVIGNFRTIGPAAGAILWNSAATGRLAVDHDVLSAVEQNAFSGAIRPVTSRSRRTKALWNIAMQAGLQAHAVGWHPTSPVEPLNGSCIALEFAQPFTRCGEPWPVPPHSIFPDRLIPELSELRLHVGELTGDDLLPFIPGLAEIDQEADMRPLLVGDIIAGQSSMHAAVTWLLEHEAWDLMMIGWSAIARTGERFLPLTAPRLPHISEEECELYGEVLNGMYCFQDLQLGRIVHLAGPDATIILASPIGFRAGDERPTAEGLRDRPGAWVKPFGMFCMAGPNVRHDELLHGVNIFDLAPTVLSILGLPAGVDMPGRVLMEAFEEPPKEERIPSWEEVPGECGMHPKESDEERRAAGAAIAQLKSLGYSEPEMPQDAAALVYRDRLLNRALSELCAARYPKAREALEELTQATQDSRVAALLAYSQMLCGEHEQCAATLRGLELEGANAAMAGLMQAQILGDSPEALEALRKVESSDSSSPVVIYLAGAAYTRIQLWDDAERLLRRAIALDPVFQPAHDLLSRVLQETGKSGAAANSARAALEIDYGSAWSHFVLGLALIGTGEEQAALEAFQRSRGFDPELRQAGSWAAAVRLSLQMRRTDKERQR